MPGNNTKILIEAARKLAPLLDDLVFLGGCATALFLTDPAAAEVRTTFDVDAIVDVGSYREYQDFAERLRALGFSEDFSEGAPICRWKHATTRFDLMPLDEAILGFSNRWYRDAMEAAVRVEIEPRLVIRLITAPYFLAMKLEAFHGRGKGDYLASHDLEDVLCVVDGRPGLVADVQSSPGGVRRYFAEQIARLISDPRFHDALPGHLPPDSAGQARIGLLTERLERLAALR